MLIAVDCSEEITYTPFCERTTPVEKRTTFQLVYPDAEMMRDAENDSSRTEAKGTKISQIQTPGNSKLTLLENCLKGWSNLCKRGGQPVVFRGGSRIMESLSMIPSNVRDELHSFLTSNTRHLRMLAEEAKERGWKPAHGELEEILGQAVEEGEDAVVELKEAPPVK